MALRNFGRQPFLYSFYWAWSTEKGAVDYMAFGKLTEFTEL